MLKRAQTIWQEFTFNIFFKLGYYSKITRLSEFRIYLAQDISRKKCKTNVPYIIPRDEKDH